MSCNYSIHNGQPLLSLFLSSLSLSFLIPLHITHSTFFCNKCIKNSKTKTRPYPPIPKFNRVYCSIKFSPLTLPLPSYQNLISHQKYATLLSFLIPLTFPSVLHFPLVFLSKDSIFIRFATFSPLTIIITIIITPFNFYPISPPTQNFPEKIHPPRKEKTRPHCCLGSIDPTPKEPN